MTKDLADPSLTLARVATSVGVSERELQLIFVEAGVRFGEELRTMRMEKAATLIGTTSGVGEVAREVGYSHANHLRGPFEQRFGVSPSVLRRARIAHLRYERRRERSLPESPRSLNALDNRMRRDRLLVTEVQSRLSDFAEAA